MKNKIPILLYHDLVSPDCPNEKTNLATMDTVVDAEDFESQMGYLHERGYRTISLLEFFKLKSKNIPIPDKSIIITFDDGHYSNYHIALPVLKKYRFSATFFIISDKIDEDYYLTEKQLKEMHESNMEIGSHGATHNYLPLLDDISVNDELNNSKIKIESVIQDKIAFFAFPGGHYNKKVLSLLKETDYTGACSCLQGFNSFKTKPFLLKRIEVRKGMSLEDFADIFNAKKIFFYQAVDFFKVILKQIAGLERYKKLRTRLYKYYFFKR